MGNNTFRDFIPEGEDTGGLGKGFADYVPPKVEEDKIDHEEEAEKKYPINRKSDTPVKK